MGTEKKYTYFSDVYSLATFKIRDYTFLDDKGQRPGNPDVKEGALGHFLLNAITDFQNTCTDYDLTDFDRESEYPHWNYILPLEVQEILALGITYHWMEGQTFNTKHFKNMVVGSGYTTFSPSNLLAQMSALKEKLHDEYQGKMNKYSFYHSDIEDRKV